MSSELKVKWIAKGDVFKQGAKPNPTVEGDINIRESGNGLNMPHAPEERFGSPISAKVAVTYIRQLWDAVDHQGLLTLAQDTNNIIEKVRHSFTGLDMPQEDKDKLFDAADKIAVNVKKAQDWLVELLDSSVAITMDKNIILKTLSQDECQGMRFYLCMKNKPGARPAEGFVDKLTGGQLETVLTLCTVGVSGDGKDLLYEYPEGRAQSRLGSPIPDIEDVSLAGEYPLVSGKLCTKPFEDPTLTPYTFYKFARTVKPND